MTFLVAGVLSVAATIALACEGESWRMAGWRLSMLSALVVVVAQGARFGFLSDREIGLLFVTAVVTLADAALSGSTIGSPGEDQERIKDVLFHALRVTLVCCVACQQVTYPGMGAIHEIGLATSNAVLFPMVICLGVLIVRQARGLLRSSTLIFACLLFCLVLAASLNGGIGPLGVIVRKMLGWARFAIGNGEIIVLIVLVWFVFLSPPDELPLFVLLPIGCAAYLGNALLSVGIAAVGIARMPRDTPQRKRALFVAACFVVCAVATAVSFAHNARAYAAACDWLGTLGFSCGDPHHEPLQAITSSGGLLGTGFGPEPDIAPMARRPTGGAYDLAACLSRLGFVGGIGITVPWVACAVLGMMSLREGDVTATAVVAAVMGITQTLCVLACLGVLPALCPREVPVCASYAQRASTTLVFVPFARMFDAIFAFDDENLGEEERDAAAQES